MLLGCLVVLSVAVYLSPDPRGFGTHEQLGAAPCGMLIVTGLPCPTCGMTTAFSYTVRGQWIRAFWAQPAGFVLALGTAAMALAAIWAVFRARWPQVNIWWLTPYRFFMGLLVLILAGWVFKIVTGLASGELPRQ